MTSILNQICDISCPTMNLRQRLLLVVSLFVIIGVVIISATGHAYLWVEVFIRGVDELALPTISALVFFIVAVFEVIGVNTTLMALAVGYIYGLRYSDTLTATLIATVVAWVSVSAGCVIAYGIGRMVLMEWSRELARRNPIVASLDRVLAHQGFKTNVLLRFVVPDIIINFSMATSQCPFWAFLAGFIGLLPWIAVHCWYGAKLESLSSFGKSSGDSSKDVTELIVTLIATTLLSVGLFYYTKQEIERMTQSEMTSPEPTTVELSSSSRQNLTQSSSTSPSSSHVDLL